MSEFKAFPQSTQARLKQNEKSKDIHYKPPGLQKARAAGLAGTPRDQVADPRAALARAQSTAEQREGLRDQIRSQVATGRVGSAAQINEAVQQTQEHAYEVPAEHYAEAPMHAHEGTTMPMRTVQRPGVGNPMSDPLYVSVDLPSRFAFYDFKDLYVRPFMGLHFAKLARAHSERSILQTVEAVSSVLKTSTGDENIGHQLTVQDFYFVLYWLRLNSYSKSVYNHTTTCVNPQHRAEVEEGLKPRESLNISMVISKSTLQTKYLDEVPDLSAMQLSLEGVSLRMPRMFDTVEIIEHPQFEDAEFSYKAGIATYLDIPWNLDRRIRIDDRIEYFDYMTGDDIQVVKAFEKAMSQYGTDEKIIVQCKECGASRVTKVSLDAHSFLPSD